MLLTRPPLAPKGAFDLHVLGLPPAFALSQDQTLKFGENLNRLITTFDEVPSPQGRARERAPVRPMVLNLKRVPPKSLPAAPHAR